MNNKKVNEMASGRLIFALGGLLLAASCDDSASSGSSAAPVAADTTSPALPPGAAISPYEGKVIQRNPAPAVVGPEAGWWYVKDGRRFWIADPAWLDQNNLGGTIPTQITPEEFEAIPADQQPLQ